MVLADESVYVFRVCSLKYKGWSVVHDCGVFWSQTLLVLLTVYCCMQIILIA